MTGRPEKRTRGDPTWFREACEITLHHRHLMGDVFAFGLVEVAAKRAGWQITDNAAINVRGSTGTFVALPSRVTVCHATHCARAFSSSGTLVRFKIDPLRVASCRGAREST